MADERWIKKIRDKSARFDARAIIVFAIDGTRNEKFSWSTHRIPLEGCMRNDA